MEESGVKWRLVEDNPDFLGTLCPGVGRSSFSDVLGFPAPIFFVVTKCKSFEVNMLCYNEDVSLGWDYLGNPRHTQKSRVDPETNTGKTQDETRSKDKTGTNKTYPGPGEIFRV